MPTPDKRSAALKPRLTTDSPVYVDQVQPLVDAEGAGLLLGGISAPQVEKLRLTRGLPAVNVGAGPRKSCWRFDPLALREWWRRPGA